MRKFDTIVWRILVCFASICFLTVLIWVAHIARGTRDYKVYCHIKDVTSVKPITKHKLPSWFENNYPGKIPVRIAKIDEISINKVIVYLSTKAVLIGYF